MSGTFILSLIGDGITALIRSAADSTAVINGSAVVSNTSPHVALALNNALGSSSIVNMIHSLGQIDDNNPTFTARGSFGSTGSLSLTLAGSLSGIFSLSTLPVGFRILTAIVSAGIRNNAFPASDSTAWIQQTALNELQVTPANFAFTAFSHPYVAPFTTLGIFLNGCGVRGRLDVALVNGLSVNCLQVNGTWDIESFSWAITNPTIPTKIGSTVEITSNGDVDLTKITQLNLTYVDPTTGIPTQIVVPTSSFIIWTSLTITFLFPSAFGNFSSANLITGTSIAAGPVIVSLIGNGVQFSGEVVIGPLTIYLADASGIYQLVPGQRHDILYDDKDNGDTINVAIPNPFVQTGLVGG